MSSNESFLFPSGPSSSSYREVAAEQVPPLRVVLRQTHSAAVLLVFVLGSLVNCVVLVLFYRKPTVRSFSNRFVINMTVTHLLSCLLVTPYVFTTSLAGVWLFGDVWCQVCGAASLVLNLATVLSLLLIAVDRNCAVSSPLHYSMTVTKRRTGWLIASVWLLACLSALPPFLLGRSVRFEYRPAWNMCTLHWDAGHLSGMLYSVYLSAVGFALPLVKMTWIYCSMFRAARRSSARTGRQRSLSSSVTEISSSELRVSRLYVYKRQKPTRKNSYQGIFGEEWKAARTGIIILFSFILCWFPYFFLTVFEAWLPELSPPELLPPLCVVLCLSASVANPYIYVFRNKTTRKHLLKILLCGRRKSGHCAAGQSGISRGCGTPHGRSLLPVTISPSRPERPATLWRLVTYVDDDATSGTKDNLPPEETLLAVEPIFFTEGPVVGEEIDERRTKTDNSSRSSERLYFKFRGTHRDSTASESTDNGCASFDSGTTEDYSRVFDLGGVFSRVGPRPPLKRVRSVIEEQELYAGVLLSRYGGVRRESTGAFRHSSQESSETTLTSSTSTDSQDQSPCVLTCGPLQHRLSCRTKPKLVRQQSAVTCEPEANDRAVFECRRSNVCYVVV